MLLPEGDEGVKIPQLNSPFIVGFSFSGDKLRSDLKAGCHVLPWQGPAHGGQCRSMVRKETCEGNPGRERSRKQSAEESLVQAARDKPEGRCEEKGS